MTINERFGKIIRTLYGGNKRAFANDVGIAATVVENIVGKRQGKPSFDVIEKVCALANVNPVWIITGKGDAFDFRSEEEKENSAILDNPIETSRSTADDRLWDVIREKDRTIREQAIEIGQLRERIAQLERRLQKDASDVLTSGTANVG